MGYIKISVNYPVVSKGNRAKVKSIESKVLTRHFTGQSHFKRHPVLYQFLLFPDFF
jgi:hypothetical protein